MCIAALSVWFDQLANNERWRFLPAVIPGEAAAAIDKVYVELFAISDQAIAERTGERLAGRERLSRRFLASEYPVVSVPTMVARTLHCCIVIGEPGSGKSTLIQWLAWATNKEQIRDFDAALVVKLSAFASALAVKPQLSLLEFFFEGLGTEIDDWRPASYWLRRVAGESQRFLLLLDGWDEVPLMQRDRVRECIQHEEPYFVTVITSRPSGLPGQLGDGPRADFYHIAGLAPGAVETLTKNLLSSLGKSDLLEQILERIRGEPDLREMAANPFLLGLMVRVLTRTGGQGAAPRTLADVYQQTVTWIQEHHSYEANQKDRLTADHLAVLHRLCYDLLFAGEAPRYLFHSQELSKRLDGCSAEPIGRSRFINRTDPVFDEYTFLHATFQEYFAAEHAATFTKNNRDAFLKRAFHSLSRQMVLEFVAGMGGRLSARCRELALDWVQHRDRFHQVVLRVARVAAAGRWPAEKANGLVQRIQDELWQEIRQNHSMALTKRSVEAFAELDPMELAHRARGASGLDNWAIQCIVDAVPLSVARHEQLDELLEGTWRDFAGFDAKGGATEADRQRVHVSLTDPMVGPDERQTAVIQAGAIREAGAVPALLNLLFDAGTDRELQILVIDSLGSIGTRDAVDTLVQIVVGERKVPPELVSMAVNVLRHCGQNRKALDAMGRDRLVRRVAVLTPDDGQMEMLLAALEGCPLREGSILLDQLARRTEGRVSVRVAAIRVLATVSDRHLVQRLVATIESEQIGEVVDTLLELAIGRSLGMPLSWLERKITATQDKVKRRILLTAYVAAIPLTPGTERQRAADFLDRLVAKVFGDASATSVEIAEGLNQALARTDKRRRSFATTPPSFPLPCWSDSRKHLTNSTLLR